MHFIQGFNIKQGLEKDLTQNIIEAEFALKSVTAYGLVEEGMEMTWV